MHGQQNMKFNFHGHSSSMKIQFWHFFECTWVLFCRNVTRICCILLAYDKRVFAGRGGGGGGGWGQGGGGSLKFPVYISSTELPHSIYLLLRTRRWRRKMAVKIWQVSPLPQEANPALWICLLLTQQNITFYWLLFYLVTLFVLMRVKNELLFLNRNWY